MDRNKSIYKAVFDSPGFSADLHLTNEELTLFRECVEDQYLEIIEQLEKPIRDQLTESGIENYHKASHLIDHILCGLKKIAASLKKVSPK